MTVCLFKFKMDEINDSLHFAFVIPFNESFKGMDDPLLHEQQYKFIHYIICAYL